jgi:hypothetical protein
MHGPHGRRQITGAVVVVERAWGKDRLLADHAFAAHFLFLAVRVGNDPVATEQLRRLNADIRNAYEVCEPVVVLARRAPFGKLLGRHLHANTVGRDVAHKLIITQLSAVGFRPSAFGCRLLKAESREL